MSKWILTRRTCFVTLGTYGIRRRASLVEQYTWYIHSCSTKVNHTLWALSGHTSLLVSRSPCAERAVGGYVRLTDDSTLALARSVAAAAAAAAERISLSVCAMGGLPAPASADCVAAPPNKLASTRLNPFTCNATRPLYYLDQSQ